MKPKKGPINTMADVAEFVASQLTIAEHQRAQMRSAINTFARTLNRHPGEIIADPSVIRAMRAEARWKLAGISKARWANVLSLVTRAMAEAGIKVHRSRRNLPLGPCWVARIETHPRKPDHRDLTRFAGWCTARNITPEEVSPTVFDDYLRYLQEECIQLNPRERWHVARRAWNRGVTLVEGWPAAHVPAGETEQWKAIPWDTFPDSLRNEIAAYRKHMTTDDPFDDEHRAVKNITIDNYVQRLKVFASLLAQDGEPVKRFASLAVFLDTGLINRGLKLMVAGRSTEQAAPVGSATCNALLSVANYLTSANKLSEDAAKDPTLLLRKCASKVRLVRHGMTDKNKERLAPLEDKALCKRLLNTPLKIAADLTKVKHPTFKQAHRYQMAILLELLIHAPMRISNAAALDLTRHLYRPPAGTKGKWRINVPACEVKNGLALDYPLTDQAIELFDLYLKKFRPILASKPSSAMFVSQTGEPKGPGTLSKQFRQFIQREVGIVVNAHLMRHFTAFLYLKAHPGEYEVARRLLGHKRIETTIQFYTGLEGAQALAKYDELISSLRADNDAMEECL